MKVVLSGIYFPLAMLRYFEAALKRRSDIKLCTVGPYTGAWIPWNGGMNLPSKYAVAPDVPLPMTTNGAGPQPLPIGFVEQQLPWTPDVWLQIDAGFHLLGKPTHGKNVIVATDPHVLNYDRQRQFADIFYCMQTPYAQQGDEYLPYGYDPVWHAPEDQPQNYDACLIGLHYQQRNQLVSALQARGLTVYYDLGPCYDEARALYNQAPIGLNWSSLQDLTARVFELLAMRRLAVVNWVPDLPKFFTPGKHLATFETLEEAIEQVVYYHEHPMDQVRIAQAGYEQVQGHTWDDRIEKILETV